MFVYKCLSQKVLQCEKFTEPRAELAEAARLYNLYLIKRVLPRATRIPSLFCPRGHVSVSLATFPVSTGTEHPVGEVGENNSHNNPNTIAE